MAFEKYNDPALRNINGMCAQELTNRLLNQHVVNTENRLRDMDTKLNKIIELLTTNHENNQNDED